MTTIVTCDALVVGSGAGGAVAAYELALRGLDTIVLEEGPRVSSKQISELTGSQALNLLYRNAGLQPVFGGPKVVFGEGRCVGGSTVVNGGLLWFPAKWRVDRWSDVGGEAVPSYDEFRSYEARVSEKLSVVEQRDGDGNHDSKALRTSAERLGLTWQHPRRAVVGCVHANRCTMGCPTGAKQTVQDTYLAAAARHGALIVPNCKVFRVKRLGSRVTEVHALFEKKRVIYRPRTVVLAGGAFGTPELLVRSGLWPATQKPSVGWHANLRYLVKFDRNVDASKGTIFTTQVNEWEKRGIYLMPANATPGTLAGFLQVHGAEAVRDYRSSPEKWAVFTAQVEMRGRMRISSVPMLGRVLSHSLDDYDRIQLRFASEQMTNVLFEGGAQFIYPPVNNFGPLNSKKDGANFAQNGSISEWQLLSVHAMSSCAMGDADRGGIVDTAGRVGAIENMHIVDASALPGTTGISPQGSIMTLAHAIMSRV